jgi:putative membrane protein
MAVLAAALTLAGATGAAAQNMSDAAILGRMAAADQGEIMQAQVAVQGAQSDAARSYADMIVRDHTNHLQQVQSVASAAGVAPDTGAARDLAAHAMQATQMLQSASGADVDRMFAANMVQDHQMVIGEVQGAIPRAQNAQVRTLLQNTLPVLRTHLRGAQALTRTVGGSSGSRRSMDVHKDTGR